MCSVFVSTALSIAANAATAASNYVSESLPAVTAFDVVAAIGPSGVAVGAGHATDFPNTAVIWDAAGNVTGISGSPAIDINASDQILVNGGGTDVSAEVIAAASSSTQGSPYSYTIKISNVGALPASGVTLTDTLSAGVTFVSAVPSQGSCSASLPLVCALGNLASDAVATVQLTVIPNQQRVILHQLGSASTLGPSRYP